MTGLSREGIISQLRLDAAHRNSMGLLGKEGNVPVLVALEDRHITQDQAVSLGRLRDPEVVEALMPMVSGLDRTATQDVVREARDLARSERAMLWRQRASEAIRRAQLRGRERERPRRARTGRVPLN